MTVKVVRKRYAAGFWETRVNRGRLPIRSKWVISLPGVVIFVGYPKLGGP